MRECRRFASQYQKDDLGRILGKLTVPKTAHADRLHER